MADQKLTALSALSALTGDDLLYAVDDVAGTPTSYKVTAAVLRDFTNMAFAALTDANFTMAVNTIYVGSMAAWATADRTGTLPAVAAVGDRCGVILTGGNATYELILTAGSGDTLNGVAGGTEWSRLFIANEVVIMRCIVANTTWVVEVDGRKFEACRIDTNGTTAAHASGSSTKISAELATVTSDPNAVWDSTNKRFIPRRLGRYLIHGHLQMASMATGRFCVAQIFLNGSTNVGGGGTVGTTGASSPEADTLIFYNATTLGDYFELFVYNGDTVSRNTNNANVYFEATRIGDVL